MPRLRFILLGGFLGAGKTTTMARLARYYAGLGKRVGLVTNDQTQDLVDTQSLRAQGFPVEEVAGACFCCSFNDLIAKVERLDEAERPDVILAEPVGSCTDLVATVIQPLKDLYSDHFEIAPYAVLFKPSHGLRILGQSDEGGFSPKAAYIFRKQLEEADAIVLNAIDSLTPAEVDRITALVNAEYPDAPLIPFSARTGQGFEILAELLERQGSYGKRILQIDYDVYAEGEAEMGWHNSRYRVEAEQPFEVDSLLMAVVEELAVELKARGEVAHLKVIGEAEAGFGVANLISSQSKPELSLPARQKSSAMDLTVNARVAVDPESLVQIVERAVTSACLARQAASRRTAATSLRPGRPTPTHRYTVAAR